MDTRDTFTYVIMLVVLPIFVVVLGVSLLVIAPFWLVIKAAEWLGRHV